MITREEQTPVAKMTMEQVIFQGLAGRLSMMTGKQRSFANAMRGQWARGLTDGQESYARSLLINLRRRVKPGELIDAGDAA